jgi:hypothetical protein
VTIDLAGQPVVCIYSARLLLCGTLPSPAMVGQIALPTVGNIRCAGSGTIPDGGAQGAFATCSTVFPYQHPWTQDRSGTDAPGAGEWRGPHCALARLPMSGSPRCSGTGAVGGGRMGAMAGSGRRRTGRRGQTGVSRQDWLGQVARAAAAEAGAPAELLGEYLSLLADAAVAGRNRSNGSWPRCVSRAGAPPGRAWARNEWSICTCRLRGRCGARFRPRCVPATVTRGRPSACATWAPV